MARRRIVQPSAPGSEEITHPTEILNGGPLPRGDLLIEREHSADPIRRDALVDEAKRVVDEISCELADVVKESARAERHGRARKRFDFEVAQAAKMSPLRPDVARVIELVFVDDVAKAYRRLEDELALGDDKHSRPAEVMRALDRAESNARLAHKCYVTARVEREAWELRNHVVFGAMWLSATQALQEEKAQGSRNKQITDSDVRAKAAAIFGDEWASQEIQRKEAEAMVDDWKNLAERWASRCWGLSAMLGKTR